MPYKINGIDILTLNDLSYNNDTRNKASINNKNYFFDGSNRATNHPSLQLIEWANGYIYSQNGLGTEFKNDGKSLYAAKKGCRPGVNKIYETDTTGTYYINKFSNGEVYVSSTANSKTGQKISTTDEDIKYIFIEIVAGGGGGGGAGTLQSAGGGGGGSYGYACIELPIDSYVLVEVGGGGSRGTNAGTGGSGGTSKISVKDYELTCEGGNGGKYSGDGGSGGNATATSNTTYAYTIKLINGANGGQTSGSRGGSGINITFENYSPEKQEIKRIKNGGTSQSSSGWGGAGGASALGNGGNSAYQGYNDATEPGAGACGGGNYVLSRRDGGRGAQGVFNIFY